MSASERPTLVIVGRPNVGKSTLFNRITASRRSIVGNEPGITRDRIRMRAEWKGRVFDVIDTGGMVFGDEEEFPVLVNQQVREALDAASHVIFVVDGRSELTSTDRDLADLLRRGDKAATVAVNKCDTSAGDARAASFSELGFAACHPISAEHGRGIADLLDHATAGFPENEEGNEPDRPIRVAIIGRPNAGKSTLLNRLTGQERAIVSPTPGTTRDAVDERVERRGKVYEFVDTAGIRRKGKTREMAEKLSVVMAQRHIRLADVILFLVDTAEGVSALDANIAGYAHEAGKAVVVIVNKWDLARDTKKSLFETNLRDKLKFLDYAPVRFVSALETKGVQQIFAAIHKVLRAARRRVPTAELNRFMESVDWERATYPGARRPKIRYVTQIETGPPTFIFFNSGTDRFHFSFERFLINQLRAAFDFEGTPVVVRARKKRR